MFVGFLAMGLSFAFLALVIGSSRLERVTAEDKASNTPEIIKASHPKKRAVTSNRYSIPKPKYHDITTKAATIKPTKPSAPIA